MLRLTVIACLLGIAFGANDLDSDVDIKDKIINGRTVAITDFPYLVSLQNSGVHFCGGSILNKYVIITAAHCIKHLVNKSLNKFTIRAGSSMWNIGGQVKNVVDINMHPKYDPDTKVADIALLKLGSPLLFSSGVKAIKLADGAPKDGKIGIICGFGVTDKQGYIVPSTLKGAEVTTISRQNCSAPPWEYGDLIKPSMMCARGDNIDSCQGDSGGPLVSKATGVLWAIVSWGKGCAEETYPGVYCLIAAYAKWIKTNTDNYTNA